MKKAPAISGAEWEVMDVLWASAEPMTAGEVVDRLAGLREWSPRTVKTMLNRLIAKRALRFQKQGKRYLYRPAVRKDQCVRDESRSFLSRVFRGSAGPMLIHFVTHSDLSQEEIDALKRLLAEKRSTRPAKRKSGEV
jgi:BlaI family penicillinase repressor